MIAGSADLSLLARNLEAAGNGQADVIAAQLISQAAVDVMKTAQARAPRKTGELAQSIVMTHVNALRIIIGPTRKYGVFQEFGTASRGEFGGSAYVIRPKTGGRLHFKVNGKWVSAKEVHHPGIPPHPYMRPAVQGVMEKVQRDLGTSGVRLALSGRS